MGLLQKWKDTVNDAVSNSAWDEYDQLITDEIAEYNKRLKDTPDFESVDWHLVKAMLWVESGGPSNAAWKRRAMQIGNKGDPGYRVLSHKGEGSHLVMASQLWNDIKDPKQIDDPKINIRAGIAYLFTRMATFEDRSVDDASDTKIHEHTVAPGESLWSIAKRHKTTVASLEEHNPEKTKVIRPKQVLKYRKARIEMVITGWRPFRTVTIAQRYNVGDPDYAGKLDYCVGLFRTLKR